jgi:restriction endonuclease Mrr
MPDYKSLMVSPLKFVGDERKHPLKGAIKYISNIFNLSEEE